jgi:DNA-binding NarL/FixJ family response regulator
MPVRSVLVVDDNPLVRRMLCEFFTREGDFDVCGEAENGREAIEKAQLLSPNLIVTDLSMPVMNGLEETRVMKKLMPAVPVIIFTAHSDPFVEKEARAAGASAVVSKSGRCCGSNHKGSGLARPDRRLITASPSPETATCPVSKRVEF